MWGCGLRTCKTSSTIQRRMTVLCTQLEMQVQWPEFCHSLALKGQGIIATSCFMNRFHRIFIAYNLLAFYLHENISKISSCLETWLYFKTFGYLGISKNDLNTYGLKSYWLLSHFIRVPRSHWAIDSWFKYFSLLWLAVQLSFF